MLAAQLQRFVPFSSLDTQRLEHVAGSVRLLRLPANRWLTRRGRALAANYYLARGRVQTLEPDEEVAADDARARQPIVPGARAVRTLSPTNLLVVDPAMLHAAVAEQVFAEQTLEPVGLRPQWLEPGWEHRFLQHAALRSLAPTQWQRLLSAMRERRCALGEHVVVQGQRGGDFYVLAGGAASVRRDGVEVARLEAGDFFGEDALVLDSARNATVTMMGPGHVMALPGELFVRELLATVVAQPRQWVAGPEVCLRVVAASGGDGISLLDFREHAARLDRNRSYRVCSDTLAATVLGTFLLVQAGHRAAPVDGFVA